MGYRVGGQCFATSEEASDYRMSMVTPTIINDGSLKMPVRKSDGWYYENIKVKLTYPTCDPASPFEHGVKLGLLIMTMFVLVFGVKTMIKMFEMAGASKD